MTDSSNRSSAVDFVFNLTVAGLALILGVWIGYRFDTRQAPPQPCQIVVQLRDGAKVPLVTAVGQVDEAATFPVELFVGYRTGVDVVAFCRDRGGAANQLSVESEAAR